MVNWRIQTEKEMEKFQHHITKLTNDIAHDQKIALKIQGREKEI